MNAFLKLSKAEDLSDSVIVTFERLKTLNASTIIKSCIFLIGILTQKLR